MARETKIGLLVGLAFFIVIGILLTDHLSSSTEPQQAQYSTASSSVRGGVSSPGGAGASSPVTVVPPVVTPSQQVATQKELTAPPVIVKVGGPTMPVVTVRQNDQTQDQAKGDDTRTAKQADQPVATNDDQLKTPIKTMSPPTQSELEKVAAANGEPVVDPNAKDDAKAQPAGYTVQKGDSVSKIVAKYLGSSNKSNIDLFLKANPSLKGDPTKLMAGRTYAIPAAAAAKTAPLTPVIPDASHDADEAVAIKTQTPATPADVKKSAADSLYVVQPGDTLTRIARDQVGDVHSIAAIQDLNRDVIKGANKDVIYVGMKLRLPGNSVATNQ